MVCLFAACGKKETYKNIYISKDICPTKDEVIKNDEEHEIISVEDGGDKWICSVTPETWDKYYNETMIAIKESLEELCKDDEYAIIIRYEIAKDISSIKLFINEDDELEKAKLLSLQENEKVIQKQNEKKESLAIG